MGKKKKGPIIKKGLDEWMATYSDMITLLFCFFVMLYATSNQDETKFQYIFQAFSTSGKYINTIVGKEPEDFEPGDADNNSEVPPPVVGENQGSPPGTSSQNYVFEDLFSAISQAVQDAQLEEDVSVSASAGVVRITFKNDVLFDADSYTLKESGKTALDWFIPAIKAIEKYIASVEVQGHTADIGNASVGVNDWDLSSLRASSVVQYLVYRETTAGEKFRSEGFAQFKPLADNSTNDGRAKNRRVEIIINRNKLLPDDDQYIIDILRYDYIQSTFNLDALGGKIEQPSMPTDDVVKEIVSSIENEYGGETGEEETSELPVGPIGPAGPAGPTAGGLTDISESDYAPVVTDETGEVAEAQQSSAE